jgi:hypothetical protein
MNYGQHLCQTHTDTKKKIRFLQHSGTVQFESLYPVIFWKANYDAAVLSEKVWYIEGCPETQP